MNSTIETKCPSFHNFILRSVIPVKETDSLLWSIDGNPCQVEVVSRNANNNPDSIELICPVISKNPNYIASYEAMPSATSPTGPNLVPVFDTIKVVAIDAQGKEYNCTITPQTVGKTYKSGPYLSTVRYAANLVRNDGQSLFGVHIYITNRLNDPIYDLDIRIHNGVLNNVVGNVYFKSIYVQIDNKNILPKAGSKRPSGIQIGNKYYLAKNGQYFFPKQASFHRRLIVVPNPLPNQRKLDFYQNFGGLGFVIDGINSWHQVPSFGVTKTVIGKYTNAFQYYFGNGTLHGREGAVTQAKVESNTLKQCLENGSLATWIGVYYSNYGPFHPFYIPMQDAPSGFEIAQYRGYRLCIEDYLVSIHKHAMNTERQPWVEYKDDGDPKSIHEWVAENDGILPFDFAPFDFQINGIPVFKNAGDFNTGRASREIQIWPPHDAAHQPRYNKSMQHLVILGNDSVAKDDMQMSAELNLLSMGLYPVTAGWSGGFSLLNMLSYANAHPAQGGIMGRARCWEIDSIMAYFTIASQDWRSINSTWPEMCAQMFIISQMATGWNNRNDAGSGDQVVETAQLPAGIDVAQTFELEFEDWAKRCLLSGPLEQNTKNMLQNCIIRSAESFFHSAIYNGNNYRWFIGVAPEGGNPFLPSQLTYALTSQGDEIFNGWHVLHGAHLVSNSQDPHNISWLLTALNYTFNAKTFQEKVDAVFNLAKEEWNDHLPDAIGLLGEMQKYIGN